MPSASVPSFGLSGKYADALALGHFKVYTGAAEWGVIRFLFEDFLMSQLTCRVSKLFLLCSMVPVSPNRNVHMGRGDPGQIC